MKIRIVSVCLVIISFISPAHAGGYLSTEKLRTVAFQTGGFFMYAADGAWANPNDCTRTDAVVLRETDKNYDKAYALLLAAYMAEKRVKGYADKCVLFDGQTYNTIRGYKYLRVTN